MTSKFYFSCPGITSVKTVDANAFKPGDPNAIRNQKIKLGIYADDACFAAGANRPGFVGLAASNYKSQTWNSISGVSTRILDVKIGSVKFTSASGAVVIKEGVDWNAGVTTYCKTKGFDSTNLTAGNLVTMATDFADAATATSVYMELPGMNEIALSWDTKKAFGVGGTVYYIDTFNERKVAEGFDALPKDYFSVYRVVPNPNASADVAPTPQMTVTVTFDVLYVTGSIPITTPVDNALVLGTNPVWSRGVTISETYTATMSEASVSKQNDNAMTNAFVNSVVSTVYFKSKPTELFEQLTADGMSSFDAQAKVNEVLAREIPKDVQARLLDPSTIPPSVTEMKSQWMEPYGGDSTSISVEKTYLKYYNTADHYLDRWGMNYFNSINQSQFIDFTQVADDPLMQALKTKNVLMWISSSYQVSEKHNTEPALFDYHTFYLDMADPRTVKEWNDKGISRFSFCPSFNYPTAYSLTDDTSFSYPSLNIDGEMWIQEVEPVAAEDAVMWNRVDRPNVGVMKFNAKDHYHGESISENVNVKPILTCTRVREGHPEDETTAPTDFLVREGKQYVIVMKLSELADGSGITPYNDLLAGTDTKMVDLASALFVKKEEKAQVNFPANPIQGVSTESWDLEALKRQIFQSIGWKFYFNDASGRPLHGTPYMDSQGGLDALVPSWVTNGIQGTQKLREVLTDYGLKFIRSEREKVLSVPFILRPEDLDPNRKLGESAYVFRNDLGIPIIQMNVTDGGNYFFEMADMWVSIAPGGAALSADLDSRGRVGQSGFILGDTGKQIKANTLYYLNHKANSYYMPEGAQYLWGTAELMGPVLVGYRNILLDRVQPAAVGGASSDADKQAAKQWNLQHVHPQDSALQGPHGAYWPLRVVYAPAGSTAMWALLFFDDSFAKDGQGQDYIKVSISAIGGLNIHNELFDLWISTSQNGQDRIGKFVRDGKPSIWLNRSDIIPGKVYWAHFQNKNASDEPGALWDKHFWLEGMPAAFHDGNGLQGVYNLTGITASSSQYQIISYPE